MNNLKCYIIKDLLPLYIDNLVSEETKRDIETHIEKCPNCLEFIDILKEEMQIDTNFMVDEEEMIGIGILNKIKKSQDRLKYTLIIFSMFVAVSSTLLSNGFFSTIPLIIIVPFVLKLIFDENIIIYITAISTNMLICIALGDIAMGIVTSIFFVVCITIGILVGKIIKENFNIG